MAAGVFAQSGDNNPASTNQEATVSMEIQLDAIEKSEPIMVKGLIDNEISITSFPRPNFGANKINETRTGEQNEIIGITHFDLQTNATIANRLLRFDDGSISATWIQGNNFPSFPDRGTGYNYFDGNDWMVAPLSRIENENTGWPTIATWGTNGEMIAAHSNTGILFSKREMKGNGPWTNFTVYGPSGATALKWPQIITTGANSNTVHMLANSGVTYSGQFRALLYSRSPDGGITWDIQNVILSGTGSAFYSSIAGDTYAWAKPKGDTIAFVVASKWHDLFLMKSYDNGSTWQKTVIWEHPYPIITTNTIIPELLWIPDESVSVAFDIEGNAHVVFGLSGISKPEVGAGYNRHFLCDGIAYWNEGMGPIAPHPTNIHLTLDRYYLYENDMLVGWTQDMDGNGSINFSGYSIVIYNTWGISTMPAIHIDAQNNIFMTYSSTTEGYHNGDRFYKKLWARASDDGGNTWGDFLFVADDESHLYDECLYSQIANSSDNNVYFTFHADTIPGFAVPGNQHEHNENRVLFGKISKADFGISYCLPPDSLSVAELTNSTATISWMPAGVETEWELLIGDEGFDPDSTGTLIEGITVNPFTLDSLVSGTTYDVYVRAVCGINVFSEWAGPLQFITLGCPPYSLPLFENFDALTPPELPECWSSLSAGNGAAYTSPGGYSNPNHLYIQAGSGAGYCLVSSPQLDQPLNESRIIFFACTDYLVFPGLDLFPIDECSHLEIGTINDPDNINTFEPIQNIEICNHSWKQFYVYFNNYEGENQYIAFRVQSDFFGGNTTVKIDDILIEPIPSCVEPLPSSLTAENFTINSAKLSWITPINGEYWDIEWGESGFTQGEGTLIQATPDNPYLLENLSHSTTYDFYVRTSCGDGDYSVWVGPHTFTTLFLFEVPYFQNFDDTLALPPGWSGMFWVDQQGGINNTHALTYHFWALDWYWYGEANSISTVIKTHENNEYKLHFSYRIIEGMAAHIPSEDMTCNVQISTDYGASYTTILTIDHTNHTPSIDFTEIEIVIPLSFTGDVIFQFFHSDQFLSDGGYNVYIDDFKLVPVCDPPADLIACNLSFAETELSWMQYSFENEWEILYGQHGFDPETDGTLISEIADTTYMLTDLWPETTYDVYIRSVCFENVFSEWSEPYTFTSAFYAPFFEHFDETAELPAGWSGDFEINPSRGTSGTNALSKLFGCNADTCISQGYLLSPTIELFNFVESQLVFNYRIVNQAGNAYSLGWGEEILIEISGDCGESYFLIDVIDLYSHIESDDFAEKIIDLPWIADFITVRISFAEAYQANQFFIDIDDILITPCYYKPFGLFAHFITDVDAELWWATEGYEYQWDILWGVAGFNPDYGGTLVEGVYEMPFFLDGLEPDTEYDFYVRANCDYGFISEWAGPETFSTQPECPEVWDLDVYQPNEFSIGLTWEPLGLETSWDVTFTSVGKNDPKSYTITVYEPLAIFGDLPPGSNWEATVRANCPCNATPSFPPGIYAVPPPSIDDCDYLGPVTPPKPCVVPELNQGGIFLKVFEERYGLRKVRMTGYEWEYCYYNENEKQSEPVKQVKNVSIVNGYSFLEPPVLPINAPEGSFITNDFLNEIILFDIDGNRIGHIPFSYSFAWESMNTRNAVLFFHNGADICGGEPDDPNRFFPYHQNSPNNIGGKYNYYDFGEYPVSMLIPPHFQSNEVSDSPNMGYKFPKFYDNVQPLIFIHGLTGSFSYQVNFGASPEKTNQWGDQVSYWHYTERMINHHKENGNRRFHAWQFYYPNEDDLNHCAKMLRRAVNYLYNFYSEYDKKIGIIAHSMGGLVTMEYLTTNSYTYNTNVISKVLLSQPPIHGSAAANRMYLTNSGWEKYLAKKLEFDRFAPCYRDMSIGSDFLYKLHKRNWSLLLNKNDIFVLIGLTDKDYRRADYSKYEPAINSINAIHQEAALHDDGIASFSSASLLDQGIGLMGFYGNHDDGKFGDVLHKQNIYHIIRDYFNINNSYEYFKNASINNANVRVFIDGAKNVIKPSGINNINNLSLPTYPDIVFKKGMITLTDDSYNGQSYYLIKKDKFFSSQKDYIITREPYPAAIMYGLGYSYTNKGRFFRNSFANERGQFIFSKKGTPQSSFENIGFDEWTEVEDWFNYSSLKLYDLSGIHISTFSLNKKILEHQFIWTNTSFKENTEVTELTPTKVFVSYSNDFTASQFINIDDQTSSMEIYLYSSILANDSVQYHLSLESPDGIYIDSTSLNASYFINSETTLKVLTIDDPTPGKWQILPVFDFDASDTISLISLGKLASQIKFASIIEKKELSKGIPFTLDGLLSFPDFSLLNTDSVLSFAILSYSNLSADTIYLNPHITTDTSLILSSTYIANYEGVYNYTMITEGLYNNYRFERAVYGDFVVEDFSPSLAIPDQEMDIYNSYLRLNLTHYLSCPGCDYDSVQFNVTMLSTNLDSTVMYHAYNDTTRRFVVSIDHDALGYAHFLAECFISDSITVADTFRVRFTPPVKVYTLGTSENAYSWGSEGGQRSLIWADDNIKTISLIHGMGGPLDPDGFPDNLGYDLSKDGGKTWSLMNECWTAKDASFFSPQPYFGPTYSYWDAARLPNHAIYNPQGNVNPDSAYVVFHSPLADLGDVWPGYGCGYNYGFGISNLGNSLDTTYNIKNSKPSEMIMYNNPKGFTITQDGYVWVTDINYDYCYFDPYNGSLIINHGSWDNELHDFTFEDFLLPLPTLNNQPPLDSKVAFAPNGQIGYIAILSDNGSNEGFEGRTYYPIFWRTEDGGTTWQGPINVHLSGENGIAQVKNFLNDDEIIEIHGSLHSRDSICFTTAYDFDMVVDSLGNPHLAVVVGVNTEPDYDFYDSPPYFAVFSISSLDGGLSWNAIELGRPKTFRGIFNFCYEDNRVQNAITMDGTKMFFTWQDTDIDSLNNLYPNIYVRGVDLHSLLITGDYNMSRARNASWKIEGLNRSYFHATSHYVLTENGAYKVPVAYQALSDSTDLNQYVEFKYIDNIVFWDDDFAFENNGVAYTLNVDSLEYHTDYFSDTLDIEVISNTHWVVETEANWLEVITEKGRGTSLMKVHVLSNTNYYDRMDTLVLKTVWGDHSIALIIKQDKASPSLSLKFPDDLVVPESGEIQVPIILENPDAIEIEAIDMVITYSSAVIELTNATLTGSILEGQNYNLQANTAVPGQITIIIYAGGNLFSGEGDLCYISLSALGNIGSCSDLSFVLHEINEVEVGAEDAEICIVQAEFDVSGTVLFFSTGIPVPNALITLSGDDIYEATTDLSGNYIVESVLGGDYISTPGKLDDLGGLSGTDASRIARFSAGLIQLNCMEQIAADVSLNGSISGVDASRVARYSAGLITELNPDNTNWVFTHESILTCEAWPPIGWIGHRSYVGLNQNITEQDFIAVRLGDVTGNWTPDSRFKKEPFVQNERRATLDPASGFVSIFINIDESLPIEGVDIILQYEKSSLSFREMSFEGAVFDGLNYHAQVNDVDGLIKLVIYSTADVYIGNGRLAKVSFDLISDLKRPVRIGIYDLHVNENRVKGWISLEKEQVNEYFKTNVISIESGTTVSGIQVFPNPFDNMTCISYNLATPSEVIIHITDIKGNIVKRLVEDSQAAGNYDIYWDGSNESNIQLSNGVYLVVFKNNKDFDVKRIVLLR